MMLIRIVGGAVLQSLSLLSFTLVSYDSCESLSLFLLDSCESSFSLSLSLVGLALVDWPDDEDS